LKFREQETCSKFEHTAGNDVKNILSTIKELEVVEFF